MSYNYSLSTFNMTGQWDTLKQAFPNLGQKFSHQSKANDSLTSPNQPGYNPVLRI